MDLVEDSDSPSQHPLGHGRAVARTSLVPAGVVRPDQVAHDRARLDARQLRRVSHQEQPSVRAQRAHQCASSERDTMDVSSTITRSWGRG